MASVLKKADLSIIIPALNCFKYTKELIKTIKTAYDYGLVLIDNGSTDGTSTYFEALRRFRYASVTTWKENKGVAAAWNFGIKQAIKKFNSQYFLIVNTDVLLHPDSIDVLIDGLRGLKLDLVSGTDVSGSVSFADDIFDLPLPGLGENPETPEFSCFMLKKATIDKVGYFDEKFFPAYFEDNDYHYRMRLAGLKAVRHSRALYFHWGSRTIQDNDKIKSQSNLGYMANRDYYIKKWGGKPGAEKFSTPFGVKECRRH